MIENKSCQEFLVKGLSQEGTLRGVCGDKAKMGIFLFLFFFCHCWFNSDTAKVSQPVPVVSATTTDSS